MKNKTLMAIDYESARDLLLEKVKALESEKLPLTESYGRILARDLYAGQDIPAFDRSAYDGYAFRASDTNEASDDNPVRLLITEDIPAGSSGRKELSANTAAKISTGAPVPPGADTVIMYEKTEFTDETVVIRTVLKRGENIVRAGEDIAAGQLLVKSGSVIDSGVAGSLAAQAVQYPELYKVPCVGIISTGSELLEIDGGREDGKIIDSNRYMLGAALKKLGLNYSYIGSSADSLQDIANLISSGLENCDALISTGGVSAGDYDFTPAAMELAGVEVLVKGVLMKPGMACAYGMKAAKPIFALSGNPASAITNFHAVVSPVLKKLAGWNNAIPDHISVSLESDFNKRSVMCRLLRGKLDLSDGKARLQFPDK